MSDIAEGGAWGAYTIERRLGRGPTGSVYLARETASGRAVGLKIFHDTIPEPTLDRFEQESRRLLGLVHPSILAVTGFERLGRSRARVTEPFEGRNLRDLGSREGDEGAAWLQQASRGLSAAWGRLALHRNLKPENILVGADGRLVLSDFGLDLEPTLYWSPERRQGRNADLRGDFWSLGRLFRDVARSPSPSLEAVLDRLTRENPVERFQMVEDLLAALDTPPPAPAPPPPPILRTLEPEPAPEPGLDAGRAALLGTLRAVSERRSPAPKPSIIEIPRPFPVSVPRPAPVAVQVSVTVPARRGSPFRAILGCLAIPMILGVAISTAIVFWARPGPGERPSARIESVPEVAKPVPRPVSPKPDPWGPILERAQALREEMKYAEGLALLGQAEAPEAVSKLRDLLRNAVIYSGRVDRAVERGGDPGKGEMLRRLGPEGARDADRLVARWLEADWKRTLQAAREAESPWISVRLWTEFLARSHGGGVRRSEAEAEQVRHQAEADYREAVARSGTPDQAVATWKTFLAKPHQGGARRKEAEAALAKALDLQRRTIAQGSALQAVALEPGGARVALHGGKLRVLDVETREESWAAGTAPPAGRLAFAAGRLAVGSSKKATLWDLKRNEELGTRALPEGPLTELSFDREGRTLAAGTNAGHLTVWNEAGEIVRAERDVARGIQAVALSPDGTRVAAGGWDKKIYLWPLPTGPVRILEGPTARIGVLAWSPNGRILASSGSEKTVYLWNGETGAPQGTLEGLTSNVTALAWSPDGFRVAAGCMSGKVRIWDPVRGGSPKEFSPHGTRITLLGLLKDGDVLTATLNGLVFRSPPPD
jgi:serine/threonine protein kinase